ncbi:hypothetical protein BH09ACT10_BH09ACT10_26160 [soil metagenome]
MAEDNEFASSAIQNLFDAFWSPEIERRGGASVVDPLAKALAIFMPGQPIRILLNDEAVLHVKASLARTPMDGDGVPWDDIEELEDLSPVESHPDAGWVAFLATPTGGMIAFDLDPDPRQATALQELATQYRDVAYASLASGFIGPGLENADAAAGLAITAMAYASFDQQQGQNQFPYGRHEEWVTRFTGLGNASRDFYDAVAQLARLQHSSRYAHPAIDRSINEARALVDEVSKFVDYAGERVRAPRTALHVAGPPKNARRRPWFRRLDEKA